MISLVVIEEAIKLREQLKSINCLSGNDKKLLEMTNLPIIYSDENYLLKMKTDTSFLAESELNKWFNFSKRTDPFLVTPSTLYVPSRGVSK